MDNFQQELKSFAVAFRDGVIGTQPKASRNMCIVVSAPLRAALKVLMGVETNLITENGHTFLVTVDGQYLIDPTIDQFEQDKGKVLVDMFPGTKEIDSLLTSLPFLELMENFKRLYSSDGEIPDAQSAGAFVAEYIYFPLAMQGLFDSQIQ